MRKEKFLKEVARLKRTKTNLKAQKVALALLDNFVWDNVDGLEEEVGRLSYSVNEWFDEKFDQFVEVRGQLRDVYINNSEAFATAADAARDEEILNTLLITANELGIPVTTLYPDYERHLNLIGDLKEYESAFDGQRQELESYGV